MESFLRVDAQHLTASPSSSSFLTDEVSSICPLITPSPPTNALINPLQETTEPDYNISHELATKLQQIGSSDEEKAESASSSSSALAEPACIQLLNHRNGYLTKTNGDENHQMEETNGKTQPLQLTFRNPPDNYFFMTWNWPLLRRLSTWFFLSGLVAMVALVIAMIATLPKTCNPPTFWYQGNLFYEIFPASFYSADRNMEGDFKGIALKADYIKKLGVRAVRLNSIFVSKNYPYDYENVTSLTEVAKPLGGLDDFKAMVERLNSRNISVVLDLPVYPFVGKLVGKSEAPPGPAGDAVEEAILYWLSNGVEGFYLKGLEHLSGDPNLVPCLRSWKRLLGDTRVAIVSEAFTKAAPKHLLRAVYNNVDLVDVKLDLEHGATEVSKTLSSLHNSSLFTTPGMPWVHWSLGSAASDRLADTLPYGNGTLGATLLQLMLPGTPSLFYGDELGLRRISDHLGEKEDIRHLHQLTMMPWPNQVLPWLHGDDEVVGRFDQVEVIGRMVELRETSPSIYMNAVYKEGSTKANAEVKYAQKEFLVVQRWYPRRRQYVVACNLGRKRLTTDLSTVLYSGDVVIGPRPDSKAGAISFKDISLSPGESVVVVLK